MQHLEEKESSWTTIHENTTLTLKEANEYHSATHGQGKFIEIMDIIHFKIRKRQGCPPRVPKKHGLAKTLIWSFQPPELQKKFSSCSFKSPSLWHCYDSPRKLIQKVYGKNKKKHATELRIKDYFLQHTNSFSTSKRK